MGMWPAAHSLTVLSVGIVAGALLLPLGFEVIFADLSGDSSADPFSPSQFKDIIDYGLGEYVPLNFFQYCASGWFPLLGLAWIPPC